MYNEYIAERVLVGMFFVMSNKSLFTEFYEVHVKSDTFDETLNISASSSELLKIEDVSGFLRNSALSELRKLGIETKGINLTDFTFKQIEQ